MIERKPHKFSLNSSETNGLKLPKEDSSSFFSQQRNKTAAETATSILKELGINKSSENESVKSNAGNIGRKAEQKIYQTKKNQDQQNRKFKDFDGLKPESKNYHSRLKNEDKKKSEPSKINFGLHENLILFVMFCVLAIAGLAFVGGYLKIFDSSIFYQLTSKNLHHLEFEGEFKARQVENGYNRLPLLIVEGNISNSLDNSYNVQKIQLKASAFDSENRIIASHFAYAGNVLTDEHLEKFSPLDIKAMRHSEGLEIPMSEGFPSTKEKNQNTVLQKQRIPFQLVFFKAVKNIKRTSIQIVSYVRNNKILFIRSPDLQ
jgi:hypothetical protein